jgi:hypothetical protein
MRFDQGVIARIDGRRSKRPGLPPRAETIHRLSINV